jgi:hypothetical protein
VRKIATRAQGSTEGAPQARAEGSESRRGQGSTEGAPQARAEGSQGQVRSEAKHVAPGVSRKRTKP